MKGSKSKIQILVVEDEVLLAKDITMRLEALDYNVIGIASNTSDALNLLRQNSRIDIALLDIVIQGDKDGIDLAKIINSEFKIPFIFLSSHMDTQVLERVKQVGAYAYILKPFNDRQVSIAIELALVNFSNNVKESNLLEKKTFLREDNQLLQINDGLFLKKDNRFERVAISDVLYLKADGNYTSIYTTKGTYLYTLLLKTIEDKFPADAFIRVHRSYMVNIAAIDGFEGNLLYIGSAKIPVSKTYREHVFKLFLKL